VESESGLSLEDMGGIAKAAKRAVGASERTTGS